MGYKRNDDILKDIKTELMEDNIPKYENKCVHMSTECKERQTPQATKTLQITGTRKLKRPLKH
jgi:hypothetical protein